MPADPMYIAQRSELAAAVTRATRAVWCLISMERRTSSPRCGHQANLREGGCPSPRPKVKLPAPLRALPASSCRLERARPLSPGVKCVLLLVAAVIPAPCATRSLLLGDAERGAALFKSLNCIVCHSVGGVGGKKAPDLGQGRDRGFSPYDMAALMWNHAPAMWGATASARVTVPAMDEQQAADLFVYFYAAGY